MDIAPDTSVIDIIAAHVKRRERTWEVRSKAREFVSTAARPRRPRALTPGIARLT